MPNPFENIQRERRRGRQDFRDPKKHFVRVHGWLPAFRSHANTSAGRVRYLTLCGKEAIDVRYFANKGLLHRELNYYPTLTFVESDEEDYAIIAETLGRFRLGVRGRLEEALLDPENPYYLPLLNSFPYDIINLDFCGDIVPQRDHPHSQTIKCIEKILELQAGYAPEWHLFLTFRAQRSQSHEEANDQLKHILDQNLEDGTFRTSYGMRPPPSDLLNANYPEFLRLGIAKFLTYSAKNKGLIASVDSSWVYGRHEGAYHIIKLVIALKPLRPPTALPNPGREIAAYSESVRTLFGSTAVDVDAAIPASRAAINQELEPVLAELQGRIVTA